MPVEGTHYYECSRCGGVFEEDEIYYSATLDDNICVGCVTPEDMAIEGDDGLDDGSEGEF